MNSAQQKIISRALRECCFTMPRMAKKKYSFPTQKRLANGRLKSTALTNLAATLIITLALTVPAATIWSVIFIVWYQVQRSIALRMGPALDQISSSRPIRRCGLQQLLCFSFNVDQFNCKCIYLGEPTFGIFIPSSAFGIEHGAVFLDDLYEEVFLKLSRYAALFELQVSRSFRIPIENTLLPCGKFAIPFLIDEFSRLPKPLEDLASSPRFRAQRQLYVGCQPSPFDAY